MINVLEDDFIPVQTWSGGETMTMASIPGVIHLLATREVKAFTRLREHQRAAWHRFLVQLTMLAMQGEDPFRVAESGENAVRDRIFALTDGSYTPWELVVRDLEEPAFLQPPVPPGELEGSVLFEHVSPSEAGYIRGPGKEDTPDRLDVITTTRGHTVKDAVLGWEDAHAVDWVYALMCRQTLGVYSILGPSGQSYHIARVESNHRGRGGLQILPGLGWGENFRTNVRQIQASTLHEPDPDRIRLLWTVPWYGGKGETLSAGELSPLFIDCPVRLRLSRKGDGLTAWVAPVKGPRVEKGEGVPYDPWQPVTDEGVPISIQAADKWQYRRLAPMITGTEHRRPACMEVPAETIDGAWKIHAESLTFGQCVRYGLWRRIVEVPELVVNLMQSDEGLSTIRERSDRMLEMADTMVSKVFRTALNRGVKGRTTKWIKRLHCRIDEVFFPRLWVAVTTGGYEDQWSEELDRMARQVMGECLDKRSGEAMKWRYWHRNVNAVESAYNRLAQKHFFEEDDDDES